jgi:serine/threonine protein kinase
MPLTIGARLGAFEIVGALGDGGMGEVYRARDTKLDRDVAIKILPEVFAGDPDRRMRFDARQRRWRRSTIPTSRRSTQSKSRTTLTRW